MVIVINTVLPYWLGMWIIILKTFRLAILVTDINVNYLNKEMKHGQNCFIEMSLVLKHFGPLSVYLLPVLQKCI